MASERPPDHVLDAISVIYKIVPDALWRDAEQSGRFAGSPVDLADGYIHFSTAAQVAETAAKHFGGQEGLLLVAVPVAPLGDRLRWEPSRGGALFPHLYAALSTDDVLWVRPIGMSSAGAHQLPPLDEGSGG